MKTLGIDLDGCVDESPFISMLSHCWDGEVVVITFRSDKSAAERVLKEHNVRYTDLVLVDRFDGKADVIKEKNVSVYIDDQPEMIKNIPTNVTVLLFRNDGNFDQEDQKWIMSNQTAKLI